MNKEQPGEQQREVPQEINDLIRKSVRDYLMLPTHRQIEVRRKLGYEKNIDNSISLHEDNKIFFKWIVENDKREELFKLFGYSPAVQPSSGKTMTHEEALQDDFQVPNDVNLNSQAGKEQENEGLINEIKKMAERFADKCFVKNSFRWQKVVQYYTQGINDWIAKKIFEDLAKQEDKPPFSMPLPVQEPFNIRPASPSNQSSPIHTAVEQAAKEMAQAIKQTFKQYNESKKCDEKKGEYEVSFLYPADNKAFQMLMKSLKNYERIAGAKWQSSGEAVEFAEWGFKNGYTLFSDEVHLYYRHPIYSNETIQGLYNLFKLDNT